MAAGPWAKDLLRAVGLDFFTKLASGTGPVFVGPLKKYRAISGRDVAKAMCRVATKPRTGPRVVHRYAEIGNLNM